MDEEKLAICVTLLDGPAKGQVVENVPVHALNIETAEYALVPKYVLRYHHYSMDGRYLSTEDAPPYDDDHEKCRYRDEAVELIKERDNLIAAIRQVRTQCEASDDCNLLLARVVKWILKGLGE